MCVTVKQLNDTLVTANHYGLKVDGHRSSLLYFEEPETGSTLAIEDTDISPDALVSAFYRWQYRWYTHQRKRQ